MSISPNKKLGSINLTRYKLSKFIPEISYRLSERSNNRSRLFSNCMSIRKNSDEFRNPSYRPSHTPVPDFYYDSTSPMTSNMTNYNTEMQKALKFLKQTPPSIERPFSPYKRESFKAKNSSFKFLNSDEIEVKKFVDALFSKEVSSYRRVYLSSESETVGFTSADKILQEAKKIMKNGVKKKIIKSELGIIEDFWVVHISKEKTVRWDIFEDNFLAYLISYMVTDTGILRKVNWRKVFQKLFAKIGKENREQKIWVLGPCYDMLPEITHRTISLVDWSSIIVSHEIVLLIFSCIDEIPSLPIKKAVNYPYAYACGCKYKGQWHDNRRQGVGLLEMCSKETYDGIFANGLFQDFATFSGWGLVYKGYFKKDLIHGFGHLLYPDGSYFEGVIDKGLIQAGSVKWSDGRFYKGEFYNNNLEGNGKMIKIDGTTMEGMWHCGKLHGDGILKFSNGKKLKGVFIENELQGIGKMVCSDYKYIGEFEKSKPNGKGKFIYKDGSLYIGDVKEGKIEGKGVFKYGCGDVYEGEFYDGMPEGIGKMVFACGNVYIGSFEAGKLQGHGRFEFGIDFNIKVYEGEVRNGVMDGFGKAEFKNGGIFEGNWVDNNMKGGGKWILKDANGQGDTPNNPMTDTKNGSIIDPEVRSYGKPDSNPSELKL